jgi:formylglycine-generating enzyme required for sulfatase activity
MGKAGKVLLPGVAVVVIAVVAIALAGSHILRPRPAPGVASGGPSVPTYRDCADVDAAGVQLCPLLTTVPVGHFAMGSKAGEGEDNEHPLHNVTIGKPLAVAVDLVTRGQYQLCVTAGVCAKAGKAEFRQDDSHPVVMVSFKDAQAYTTWLSLKTGKHYRLPSEAEWEYFARAGSTSAYPWGDSIGSKNADCGDCGSPWDNRSTAPVGSFGANAFGLHDTVGNAWQWVADCYHDSYAGAPADGSAWDAGADCPLRPRRGGAWNESSHDSRNSARVGVYATARNNDFGFRVVRDE